MEQNTLILEQKIKELAQQYQHTIRHVANQHISQIKLLRLKFITGWDAQYCRTRSSLIHFPTSHLLTEQASSLLAEDADIAHQQASLIIPQNKPVVSVSDIEEQFMHELSLMTLEQESKYESLRIQQLKELLRVEQTLSKAKNQWNHVVWEGKLDKLNQGSCIGELQFLSPTAVALENIPPVLLMNNRVELRELEEIIESNNILFFITRLLSRDKETISLFNREVRRVHDQHKAGRVTVAKHTHLYFIPLTKITLPSTPCSGLTSLLEDPRGKFLVVAPNHCSVAQKRVANEKWQLDLAKDWPHFRNNEQQS